MNNAKHFIPLTDTPDPIKAKQSTSIADDVAAFLARGGVIQQAESGAMVTSQTKSMREQNDENWKRSRVELTLGNKQ